MTVQCEIRKRTQERDSELVREAAGLIGEEALEATADDPADCQ